MKKSGLYFLVISLFSACYKDLPANDDFLLCTENFVSYTLEIPGAALDGFFTYRVATQDSLRLVTLFLDSSLYPVLNDLYKDSLVGGEESFRFMGRRGNTAIDVPFVFTSDGCHIVKISGPEVYDPSGK